MDHISQHWTEILHEDHGIQSRQQCDPTGCCEA